MIKHTSYFLASKGEFRIQPTTWTEELMKSVEFKYEADFDGSMVSKCNQLPIKLGNHMWFPNFVSGNPKYDSESAYWISENGKLLLRLSNHWSKAPKGVRTKTCGNIRSCWWELAGRPQRSVKGFVAGLIAFENLTEM